MSWTMNNLKEGFTITKLSNNNTKNNIENDDAICHTIRM